MGTNSIMYPKNEGYLLYVDERQEAMKLRSNDL